MMTMTITIMITGKFVWSTFAITSSCFQLHIRMFSLDCDKLGLMFSLLL